MFKGKKYQDSAKLIDRTKLYDANEAIDLVCKTSKAKFDETVELHIRLGVDSRHADQQVRGAIVLPHGTGKSVKVLVFAKDAKADAAKEAGADYVGAEDYPEHFVFLVRSLERLGVSAVIIEDKIGLKQNSLFETGNVQRQASVEDQCHKIKVGKQAQITDDFMIIARCESLITGAGEDDAINRCRAYIEAGADGIMIHSKAKTPDEIISFVKRFRIEVSADKPIVVVPSTYPQVTESELASIGVNIVIYANQLLRAAYPAMTACAESILSCGRSQEASDKFCTPIRDIISLI